MKLVAAAVAVWGLAFAMEGAALAAAKEEPEILEQFENRVRRILGEHS